MVKDYIETVWKPYMKWIRKHWKGYLVLIGTLFLIGYVLPWIFNKYAEKIEERREEIRRLEP